MARRVLILDTSVLCCLLAVPGKATCGRSGDIWNQDRICQLLKKETDAYLVLPLAAIIETGNHVSQATSQRFEVALELAKLIENTANEVSPWAAFTEQAELWNSDNLKRLAHDWPPLAAQKISIGDATIKDVAEYYAKSGFSVEILTGDAGLKAYQPIHKPLIPRRRR